MKCSVPNLSSDEVVISSGLSIILALGSFEDIKEKVVEAKEAVEEKVEDVKEAVEETSVPSKKK